MMKQLVVNPFEKIAGLQALGIGFLLMITGALLAYFCHARFDGAIDLHFGGDMHIMKPFAEQFIIWSCLSIVFYVMALTMGSRPRPIDIAGTLALARAPFTLVPLVNSTGFISSLSLHMTAENQNRLDLSPLNISILIILIGIILLAAIWLVMLYFKAYKVSTNLKGNKLVVSFIAGLLMAEIVSVYLIRGPFNF